MGHGEEKWPEDRIVELEAELADANLSISELQRDQRADGPRPLPPRPAPRQLIHLKLIEVMREVTSVAKTGMNTQQNYPFRGIDGVMNEVGPAMRKVGVLAVPTVLQYKNRDTYTTGEKKTREVVVEVRYDFYAEDGSSVSAVVWGESLDFSDKGTAKALSVALRIALLQTLMLPTQEPSTDDNGHYHTRGGTPTLSGWTADLGGKLMLGGEAEQVIDFWRAIVESSSIEAPWVPGGMTWGEATATRIAQLVGEEHSPETLRELYGKLKAADMLGLWHVDAAGTRAMLGDLVVERGKQAKLNRDKAFNHCMELVTSADTLEVLDNARVHIRVDAEEGSITGEQLAEVLAVASERYDRLTKELNVPSPREFLPPVGYAWDQFVAFADRQNLTEAEIRSMLEGQWDNVAEAPAAHEFGLNGLIRLADAVKRSNARDHTIGNTDRANLLQLIRDCANENEISISNANL